MTATFGQGGFPANPLEKIGYQLEFHDEFDQPELDTNKWLPFYLPQWSSRARTAPVYTLTDGCLNLHITADQPAWCPEFDGNNRCSSIQTGVYPGPLGSHIGQSRFTSAVRVREEQPSLPTSGSTCPAYEHPLSGKLRSP